jgi:hypothetical protein
MKALIFLSFVAVAVGTSGLYWDLWERHRANELDIKRYQASECYQALNDPLLKELKNHD